jgi:hypothetical protein
MAKASLAPLITSEYFDCEQLELLAARADPVLASIEVQIEAAIASGDLDGADRLVALLDDIDGDPDSEAVGDELDNGTCEGGSYDDGHEDEEFDFEQPSLIYGVDQRDAWDPFSGWPIDGGKGRLPHLSEARAFGLVE